MKGVIFTEFLEMVENKFGFLVADKIVSETTLPSNGVYTAVGTYSHGEMVSLVTALSKEVDMSIPQLLKAYGDHMFGQFVKYYPHFMEEAKDAYEFLAGIENYIHVEVRKLYPDAELPHFKIEQPDDNQLVMLYHSERKMADFAEGLIEGCIRYYEEDIKFERVNVEADGTIVQFSFMRHAGSGRA